MKSKGQTGYRKVLAGELERRTARNRSYSMRAFARDLGVPSAQVVRILNGSRNLSLRTAKKIVGKLFPSKEAQSSFLYLVELETSSVRPGDQKRIDALASVSYEVHAIDTSVMRKMSWLHFTVLDLLTLRKPPRDVEGVADYLAIPVDAVRKVVRQLIELGLVVETSEGLRKKHAFLSFPGGAPEAAVRKYHGDMGERALRALEKQPAERRHFAGMSIAIRRELYPEVVELTNEYFHKLSALARLSSVDADALYQINVQVFDHRGG